MKEFSGFPARMQFTPIPNLFFSSLLPQISDILELKVTLHILAAIYIKKGAPRFVSRSEMLSDVSLMKSLSESDNPPEKALHDALDAATKRGTILWLTLNKDSVTEDVYFLNTAANKEVIARIQSGEPLGGLKDWKPAQPVEKTPDIFTLYEDNIGLLTPMVADQLRDWEKQYPAAWIRDAIKEAVSLNKGSLRYIERILERWSTEGKVDGAHRGDIKKTDPDKYIKGKYGHVVQR